MMAGEPITAPGPVGEPTGESPEAVSRFGPEFTWQAVPILVYKEDGAQPPSFHGVTRQVLYPGDEALPCQLRYFEIADGGHSTLERHNHVHVVVVLRGAGRALIGDRIVELAPFDIVRITPRAWHQFRATGGKAFGFLCLVNVERDRPERPDANALEELRSNALVAEFIRS
ncbi:MAG: cupin domain-containing protein, partial [Polyangiaceae bacterium]|jgi:quercetin dioxygenase-like cupin family protein